MIPDRRTYALSKDQPILKRARARGRVPIAAQRPEQVEADFWRSFDLEKFARDWRRGVGTGTTRRGA